MSAALTAKQMRQLLQSISADPQLKQSQDSILLAEDQYPDALEAIFTRLSTPTTMQNTMNLLQWNRKTESTAFDAELKASTIKNQDYLRNTYQLVPTADNPWDTNTFRRWKYFVTNLCLSAVQDALKSSDNSKNLQYLFSPDQTENAAGAARKSKSNVQGLLLYHPILLSSPWQAPDDIDDQIKALLATTEPVLLARSLKEDGHTTYDKDNALKQLDVLTSSIKSTLQRVYALTSHSFHVLLRDLIPRARQDKNHLFTHIKGARTDHIINLRVHTAGKRGDGLPPLTVEQRKPHSAAHTLQFIEDEYVEKDDDASHYTWNDILHAIRAPGTTLFSWVDSFTLRSLRYAETIEKISGVRLTKINKIIAKQITDDEKLTISTLNSAYSAIKIQDGAYDITELIQLLAQNVASFNKAYQPTEHQRITRYLRTRERKSGFTTNTTHSPSGKGKGGKPSNKRKATTTAPRIQRAWGYLQEGQPSSLVSPPPYSKGKGKSSNKGKGESKGKGKPQGKGKSWSKGHNQPKGTWPSAKGKSKGLNPKGKRLPKGNPFHLVPTAPSSSTTATTATPAPVRCHFCHLVGHIKPNCRKWLALQHSDQYQTRHTHDQRYQLIYDHLEDSVLAPWHCPYCSDPHCDEGNCQSTFDHRDFHEASTFFTSTINTLVLNAKLERPLDSHTPQTASNYVYEGDDWGEQEQSYDQEPNSYEQEQDVWDTEDLNQDDENQDDENQDEYQMENEEAECNIAHQSSQDSEDQDEDDQDNYE